MQVIHVLSRRGDGTPFNPVRNVAQYWSLEGVLLAEFDHLHEDCGMAALEVVQLRADNASLRTPKWPYTEPSGAVAEIRLYLLPNGMAELASTCDGTRDCNTAQLPDDRWPAFIQTQMRELRERLELPSFQSTTLE